MSFVLFVILTTILAVFTAVARYNLWLHERHDCVLFAFSRMQSAISQELHSHYDIFFRHHETGKGPRGVLSPEEIAAAKFLPRLLDDISLHYDRHKTTMFNLRKMRRMIEQDLKQYREVEREVQARLQSVPPGRVADLYAEFSQAAAKAFVAYTPFIRAEVILRLLWADLAEQIAPIRRRAARNLFGERFA